MTELAESTDVGEMIEPMTTDIVDQKELAEQLLEQAKEQNIELVGPDGLLGRLTKNVLETALDAEMAEHLGYEKHDPAGRGSGNSRNGTRAKTVLTEIGPVEIEVPRDTESTFQPEDRYTKAVGMIAGRTSVMGPFAPALGQQIKLMDTLALGPTLARHAHQVEPMRDGQVKMMGLAASSSMLGQLRAADRYAKMAESIVGRTPVAPALGQQIKLTDTLGLSAGLARQVRQIESTLDHQAKMMGLAGRSSMFGQLEDRYTKAVGMIAGLTSVMGPFAPALGQQIKLMDTLWPASVAAAAQTPEAASDLAGAAGTTTAHGIVVLDEEQSSQFLEWLRSWSPSLTEAKAGLRVVPCCTCACSRDHLLHPS